MPKKLITEKSQPNPLYTQAIEAFQMTSQWASGKTIDLLNGCLREKQSTVFLRNESGFVSLVVIVNGRKQYNSQFVIGYCNPGTGWQLSHNCNLSSFNIWHKRTKREISRLENAFLL